MEDKIPFRHDLLYSIIFTEGLHQDIAKSEIDSALSLGNTFAEAVISLYNQGYEVTSLERLAEEQTKRSWKHSLTMVGSMTREGFIPSHYAQGQFLVPARIVRHSPALLANRIEQASLCFSPMKNSQRWLEGFRGFSEEELKEAYKDCVDLPDAKETVVPLEEFETHVVTKWLYGGSKKAKAWATFLKQINEERTTFTFEFDGRRPTYDPDDDEDSKIIFNLGLAYPEVYPVKLSTSSSYQSPPICLHAITERTPFWTIRGIRK